MIQRIQSVYLLLVCILMVVTAFSPLLVLTIKGGFLDFSTCGIYNSLKLQTPSWGLLAIAGLSALLPLVNIFLYKKRQLQIRIGVFTSLLILLFYVVLAVYYYLFSIEYSFVFSGVQYGIILPLIALIFNMLAMLKIKRDEKLVRSLDRIR